MKLNDPFGRMERRNQREYETLSRSLQEAGMNDPAQAEELIAKLNQRTKTGLLIIIPLVLVLCLLFPLYWVFFAACGLLIGVWLVNTTRKAQTYIRRYVQEYLSPSNRPDAAADKEETDQ